MSEWKFGIDNDKLIELVLNKKKTATISLYHGDPSKVGEKSIILYDDDTRACIIEIKKVLITEFKSITEDLALLEGEGTFEEWKERHISFFKSIDNGFNENTEVEFNIFEVVKKF